MVKIRIFGLLLALLAPFSSYAATEVFYADPNDGVVEGNNSDYTTAGSTGTANDSTGTTDLAGQQFHFGSLTYYRWRSFSCFPSASLPDDAIIDSVSVFIYGSSKADTVGVTPSISLVETTWDCDTLVNGDMSLVGGSALATVTYASYSTSGYNEFSLSSGDFDLISLTSNTVFGWRTNRDIANIAPSSGGNNIERFESYTADETGTDKDPYMEVVYHLPSSSSSSSSPTLGTGSLLLASSFCQGFEEFETGSGTTGFTCNQWDTTIEVEAIGALRVEAGAIIYSAIFLMIRLFVIFYLLYKLVTGLFKIMTHYRPLNRLIGMMRRRR